MGQPFRVGLLLDSCTLKAWQALAIDKIQELGDASIELVVLNGSFQRAPFRLAHLLYRLYSRFDKFFFGTRNDAFTPVDGNKWFAEAATVRANPRREKYGDVFTSEDVNRIKSFDLDILIRFGFRILKGEILHAAKFGVWSFHHDDPEHIRGGPPGFWEVMEQHPVTGSVLLILTEDLDSGRVLYRSFSITDPSSVIRNRNNYYFKTAFFLARTIRQLRRLGEERFFEKVVNTNNAGDRSKIYRNPKNGQMLRLWTRLLIRIARSRMFDWIHLRQWILLFSFQDQLPTSVQHFTKIIPPPDRFWADPHVIHKDGTNFVFLEEFDYRRRKGHICVLEMDSAGVWSPPRRVLERPYHLSYPFVFDWNGEYFLVPETQKNRSIELYRCVNFPDEWRFERNLLQDVFAADTTLFYYERKWWMFTCLREQERISPFDELFLFYTGDLFTESWHAHPLNPIVSDCRRARPAGKIFQEKGKLFRPAQNSSHRYGYGIKLHEIVVLSETDYCEQEVLRIDPDSDKDVLRVHTFTREGSLIFSDAQIARRRW